MKAWIAIAALAWCGAAHAAVVDIAWDANGRFEHQSTVAAGKFAEVCGALDRDQAVQWRFTSTGPMAFNVHYHQGKDVVYPVKREATTQADGRLLANPPQTYCWMWSNKGSQAVTLQVELQR